MKTIVPNTIKIVLKIMAPDINMNTLAILSGSFLISSQSKFDKSKFNFFHLVKNMYCDVVGNSFLSFLISGR
jgi:hypothetical protein